MFLPQASTLTPEFLRASLSSRAGFAWWYLDQVDESGDGFVLTWSFGLPFLPESRRQKSALSRPALALSLYKGGKPSFYCLQEYDPTAASEPDIDGNMLLGDSEFQITRQGEEISWNIRLILPIAKSRERLSAVIQGSAQALKLNEQNGVGETLSSKPEHKWSPRALGSQAQAQFHYGPQKMIFRGRAYFDGNAATTSLREQGFQRWDWLRVSFEDESFIIYRVGEEVSLEREAQVGFYQAEKLGDNLTQGNSATLKFWGRQRGFYGIRGPESVSFCFQEHDYEVAYTHLVDDGPFYQRYIVKAERMGAKPAKGVGFSEVVHPEKIDIPWQRPFVRMRRHLVSGKNSRFLPLWNGPLKKGWRRVFSRASRPALP